MAERDTSAKLRIYHTIYRLNLSFANIVANCRALRESGILGPEDTRLYQSAAQELQADINQRLTSLLESVESDDHARFGKVTQAWEKEITDPDDVFLHAEERRKELAKQRKKRPLKGGKNLRTQPGSAGKTKRSSSQSVA
jgi:hypothetical protein